MQTQYFDREIARRRLRTQRLTGEPFESAEQVVGWLGAMQAQEYPYAKWSIGQRTAGLTDADVDAMLADGRLIRTHMLRPTWHFVLPADIRWMMSITAPRVTQFNQHWLRSLELDAQTLTRAQSVIAKALEGKRLTRPQLREPLADAGIEAAGPRLAYIVMQAELDLLICSGGLHGKQHTYALLDEVVPPTPQLSADEALAEIVRRYFTSHGPATIADFTWWSSLTAAQTKRGLELAAAELERGSIDGTDYWSGVGQPAAAEDSQATGRAHLLQGFDESVIGYQKTRGALDVAGLVPKEVSASFFSPVLIDAQLAGMWRRVPKPGEVVIEVRWLRKAAAEEVAAVENEVARHAEFLRTPARLVETSASSGAEAETLERP